MKYKGIVLGVAMFATPAAAADLGTVTYKDNGNPDLPASSLSGFYLGGGLGYGASIMSTSVNGSAAGDVSGTTETEGFAWNRAWDASAHGSADLGGYGVTGMLQLGYDHQIGRSFLIGVFADYNFYGISGNGALSYNNGPDGFDYKVEHNLDYGWTIGGRMGVVHNNSLIYVLGGWGQTHWSLGGDIPLGVKDSGDAGTWVTGAGVETRLAPGLFLGLEGRAHFLDDQTIYDVTTYNVDGAPAAGCGTPTAANQTCTTTHVNAALDPAFWDTKITLKYKFGGGH